MKLSLARVTLLAGPALFALAACATGSDLDGEDEGAVLTDAPSIVHEQSEEGVVPDHLVLRQNVLFWSTTKLGAEPRTATIWRTKIGTPQATRIADVEGGVFQMALYGSNLFVVPDESGGILTFPATAGATPKRLYDDQGTRNDAEGVITAMTATIDGVFAGRDDGTIVEVMRDGTVRTAKTGAKTPRNLGVWEDSAAGRAFLSYVDDDDSEDGTTSLVYAALRKNREGAFELPDSGWKTIAGLRRAHAVASDRDNLYIATWGASEDGDSGEILVAPADGSAAPRVVLTGILRPTSIVADERGIYFATGPGPAQDGTPRGGAIMAIAKRDLGTAQSGAEPPVRCFAQGTAPSGLAQTRGDLYWIAQGERQIVGWSKASVWANAKPCPPAEAIDAPRAPASP